MKSSHTERRSPGIRDVVLQSFLQVRDGKSADAVIADPDHDLRFLEACHGAGTTQSPFELNHCLYGLRKAQVLEDYPTTSRMRLKGQDDYRFAVEIAVRYLELRNRTTLDRIICDPSLAAEFDRLTGELAPGFTSFEYRFTALSLRKVSGLKPELVARILATTRVLLFRAAELESARLPAEPGVYIFFYTNEGVLYVGEAENLRNRIRKHLEHSDRKEVARWLWEHGTNELYVELHVLPEGRGRRERKALELELIRSRKPKFNVVGIQRQEL